MHGADIRGVQLDFTDANIAQGISPMYVRWLQLAQSLPSGQPKISAPGNYELSSRGVAARLQALFLASVSLFRVVGVGAHEHSKEAL